MVIPPTPWLKGIAALAMAASASSWSYTLDAQALKDYGGTYMLDCANRASAKATVGANSLVFRDGARRVASTSIETGYGFFRPSPNPKGFLVSLINTGPGNAEMLWHVFRDRTGQYMVFEQGDAQSQAAIGKSVGRKKLYRCDGAVAAD